MKALKTNKLEVKFSLTPVNGCNGLLQGPQGTHFEGKSLKGFADIADIPIYFI